MRRLPFIFMTAFLATLGTSAFAEGDATKGKRVFNKCRSCHVLEPDGPKRIGPNLHGIMGRKAASAGGFKYSKAFQKLDLVWDDTNLTTYLKSPRKFVPGTSMSFAGLRRDQEIADVLAYIKQETQ